MKKNKTGIIWSLLFVLTLPTQAWAHHYSETMGLWAGFAHPWLGLDHLLAMLAIGFWAAQTTLQTHSVRQYLLLPFGAILAMLLGGVLGLAQMNLSFAEQGIAASVLILGLLIATSAKLPSPLSYIMVSCFGFCHGNAHGLEMPTNVSAIAYTLGFVSTTLILISLGFKFRWVLKGSSSLKITTRLVGGVIVMAGAGLILS